MKTTNDRNKRISDCKSRHIEGRILVVKLTYICKGMHRRIVLFTPPPYYLKVGILNVLWGMTLLWEVGILTTIFYPCHKSPIHPDPPDPHWLVYKIRHSLYHQVNYCKILTFYTVFMIEWVSSLFMVVFLCTLITRVLYKV